MLNYKIIYVYNLIYQTIYISFLFMCTIQFVGKCVSKNVVYRIVYNIKIFTMYDVDMLVWN